MCPANWMMKPISWTLRPLGIGMSFTVKPATLAGEACFNACNSPNTAAWSPANRGSEKIAVMVGGLRPARSAVQKRNRLLTNASEMNDSCQSPGNYEKFTGNQARLFGPVESRVADAAQHHTTSEGATQFDCLANLWSDRAGRQR